MKGLDISEAGRGRGGAFGAGLGENEELKGGEARESNINLVKQSSMGAS